MNKYLKKILEEMCKRVGADYGIVNSSDTWYLQFEWTPEQESDFEDWLKNYVWENADVRKYFGLPKDKKIVRKFAEGFVFEYGWTLKDDEN